MVLRDLQVRRCREPVCLFALKCSSEIITNRYFCQLHLVSWFGTWVQTLSGSHQTTLSVQHPQLIITMRTSHNKAQIP